MTLERLTTISNAGISSNLSITGIITATSFVGDGTNIRNAGEGIGKAVGDTGNIFSYVSVAATVTENITLDTSNSGTSSSYVLVSQSEIHIETGIALTVGSGKSLVINNVILPSL
jgi:hypothetical protein